MSDSSEGERELVNSQLRSRDYVIRRLGYVVLLVRGFNIFYALVLQPSLKHTVPGHFFSVCVMLLALLCATRFQMYRAVGVLFGVASVLLTILEAVRINGLHSAVLRSGIACAPLAAMFAGPVVGVLAAVAMDVVFGGIWLLHAKGHTFIHAHSLSMQTDLFLFSWAFSLAITSFIIFYFDAALTRPMIALENSLSAHKTSVSELNQEEKKLRNAVATYSHEIRTPLNVVLAMADNAVDACADTPQANDAMLLQVAAKSLLTLSNNVLDASALEVRALRVECDFFDLHSTLYQMVPSVQFAAQQKGLTFAMQVAQSVPRVVGGDSLRLQQVLYNLLNNAVAYTASGEVTLHVSTVPSVETSSTTSTTSNSGNLNSTVQFLVSDTGDCITSGALFRKVHTESTHRTHAALGLYICKKLVKRMRGTISLFSRMHRCGTLARVTIPFALPTARGSVSSADSADAAATIAALSASRDSVDDVSPRLEVAVKSRALSILYADDEPANHFVLTTYLNGLGHSLLTVNDGAEAVAAFIRAGAEFDLVFLDVQMPVLDGIQAMRKIREHETLHNMPRTPIVFITAHASPEFAQLVDCDHVMQKPVSKATIRGYVTRIAETVNTKEAAGRAQEAAEILRAQAPIVTNPRADDSASEPTSRTNGSAALKPSVSVPQGRANSTMSALAHLFIPRNTTVMSHWRFTVMWMFVAVIMGLFYTLRDPESSEVYGDVIVWSFVFYLPLMRLQNKMPLQVYLCVQQMLMEALLVSHHPLGMRAIEWEIIFPPLLVLFIGGTIQLSIVSSALVVLEALILKQFYTSSASATSTGEIQFITISCISHGLLCTTFALMFAYSEWSRSRALKQVRRVITQVGELQRQARDKKQSTEQFVQSVASDFHSPISVVMGVSEVLADHTQRTGLARRMHVLQSACQLLLNMMHNMLGTAELDIQSLSETHQLKQPFNLRDVILQTASMLCFQARAKEILLRVRIAAAVPEAVCEDQRRLQQMLVGILGTAIKYCSTSVLLVTVDSIVTSSAASGASAEGASPKAGMFSRSVHQAQSYVFGSSTDDEGILEPQQVPVTAVGSPTGECFNVIVPKPNDQCQITISCVDSRPIDLFAQIPLQRQQQQMHSPMMYNQRYSDEDSSNSDDDAMLTLRPSPVHTPTDPYSPVQSLTQQQRQMNISMTVCNAGDVKGSGLSQHDDDTTMPQSQLLWKRALNILVVNDHLEEQYVKRLFLRNTPHNVFPATSGKRALELAQETTFDVCILQMELGDMPALQFTHKFQQLPLQRVCKLVCVGSVIPVGYRAVALKAGIHVLESRPLPRARLLRILRELCDQSPFPSAIHTAPVSPREKGSTPLQITQALRHVPLDPSVLENARLALRPRLVAMERSSPLRSNQAGIGARPFDELRYRRTSGQHRSLRLSEFDMQHRAPSGSKPGSVSTSSSETPRASRQQTPILPIHPSGVAANAYYGNDSANSGSGVVSRRWSLHSQQHHDETMQHLAYYGQQQSQQQPLSGTVKSVSAPESTMESRYGTADVSRSVTPPQRDVMSHSSDVDAMTSAANVTPAIVTQANMSPVHATSAIGTHDSAGQTTAPSIMDTAELVADDRSNSAVHISRAGEVSQLSSHMAAPTAVSTVPSPTATAHSADVAPDSAVTSPDSAEHSPDSVPDAARPPLVAVVPLEMMEYVQAQYLPQLHRYADDMLNAAQQQQDIKTVRAFAHKITGTAGTFGLHHVTELSKRTTMLCHADPFDAERLLSCLKELKDALERTVLEEGPSMLDG